VLLSVGRLTRRKGHDHVLYALARLKRRDLAYVVLSDGELESELHAMTRDLGLEDIVKFVGPVDARELPRYYAAADVFVLANRTLADGDVEGFGLVFLEASAAGLPVLAGRSGGVPDAVNEGVSGLLVDGSVGEIAHALERLVDDPALRRRLGHDGRQWVRERFSWERAAERGRAISGAEPAGPQASRRDATPRVDALSLR
jgi:phosphatidylinositol alpha-1,6-mannosyltransferase